MMPRHLPIEVAPQLPGIMLRTRLRTLSDPPRPLIVLGGLPLVVLLVLLLVLAQPLEVSQSGSQHSDSIFPTHSALDAQPSPASSLRMARRNRNSWAVKRCLSRRYGTTSFKPSIQASTSRSDCAMRSKEREGVEMLRQRPG